MVRIYDFKTNRVMEIPASELAPGMVQANVHGVGTVWISADDAAIRTDGPYRHPPFDADKRALMIEFKTALDDVYNKTLQEWEDGFRRDLHMEREIALWSRIAAKLRGLTAHGNLSRQQKRDYFRLFLTCVSSPREHVLQTAMPTTISRARALRAIDYFYNDAP